MLIKSINQPNCVILLDDKSKHHIILHSKDNVNLQQVKHYYDDYLYNILDLDSTKLFNIDDVIHPHESVTIKFQSNREVIFKNDFYKKFTKIKPRCNTVKEYIKIVLEKGIMCNKILNNEVIHQFNQISNIPKRIGFNTIKLSLKAIKNIPKLIETPYETNDMFKSLLNNLHDKIRFEKYDKQISITCQGSRLNISRSFRDYQIGLVYVDIKTYITYLKCIGKLDHVSYALEKHLISFI